MEVGFNTERLGRTSKYGIGRVVLFINLILILALVVFAVDGTISNFYQQDNPFNLYFKNNFTRYLSFPLDVYIKNVSIELNGNFGTRNFLDRFERPDGEVGNGWTNATQSGNGIVNITGESLVLYSVLFTEAVFANHSVDTLLNFSMLLNMSETPEVRTNVRIILDNGTDEVMRCSWNLGSAPYTQVYCSDGIGNTEIASWTKDTTYKLTLVMDYDSYTYDFYIDDVLEANDFAFKTNVKNTSTLKLQAKHGYYVFDDVDIYNNNGTDYNLPLLSVSTNLMSVYNESLNETIFNDILSNQCVCEGCILSSNCTIPLNITTYGISDLTINLTNASYSYGIDNCSNSLDIPSNATALNISFFDYDDEVVSVAFNSYLTYTGGSYPQGNLNLNNAEYCIYPNWAVLNVSQQIQYESESVLYDYYLTNYTFDNTTSNLFLYTQNDTTRVLFTVLDRGNEVADAYIHILKYDVGTGTYTTTEIIKTDSQGQAVGNIVLTTTFYNFLIYYEDSLVYTDQGVRLITTTRTFNINLQGTEWLDNFDTSLDVNTNFYFNNVTNNFVFTWSDPSGEIHYGCLRVDKVNTTDKVTLVDNCSLTTSGTIVYNIDPLYNGSEYIGTAYFQFDDKIIVGRITKAVAAIRDYFRQQPFDSLFLGFILVSIFFLAGIPNPVISASLMGGALIISGSLGMYRIAGTQLGGLIILIIIMIYLAGRQNT